MALLIWLLDLIVFRQIYLCFYSLPYSFKKFKMPPSIGFHTCTCMLGGCRMVSVLDLLNERCRVLFNKSFTALLQHTELLFLLIRLHRYKVLSVVPTTIESNKFLVNLMLTDPEVRFFFIWSDCNHSLNWVALLSYRHRQKSLKGFLIVAFIHSLLLLLFIHSFIPAISIAPLQVLYYSEALPTTARILYRSFTPKRTGNCR